jgi:hypothetical protein
MESNSPDLPQKWEPSQWTLHSASTTEPSPTRERRRERTRSTSPNATRNGGFEMLWKTNNEKPRLYREQRNRNRLSHKI